MYAATTVGNHVQTVRQKFKEEKKSKL